MFWNVHIPRIAEKNEVGELYTKLNTLHTAEHKEMYKYRFIIIFKNKFSFSFYAIYDFLYPLTFTLIAKVWILNLKKKIKSIVLKLIFEMLKNQYFILHFYLIARIKNTRKKYLKKFLPAKINKSKSPCCSVFIGSMICMFSQVIKLTCRLCAVPPTW